MSVAKRRVATSTALLGAFLLSLVGPSPAQADEGPSAGVVEFADPALQQCVATALQHDDTPITTAEAAGITVLLCSNLPIANLDGIAAISNLEKLTIQQAGQPSVLSSIAPVADLPRLTSLTVGGTAVTDFSALTTMSALASLTVEHPAVVPDLASISALTQLRKLGLIGVGDLSGAALTPLSKLSELTSLQLSGNQIDDLEPVAALSKLTFFEAGSNTISNLQPLSGLSSLEYVNLLRNNVSDVAPLGKLSMLSQLNLQWNHLADTSSLATLSMIKYLALDNNEIVDLTTIGALSRLETLTLSGNRITNAQPLQKLTHLTSVNLSANQISSIASLAGLNVTKLASIENQRISLPDITVGAEQANIVLALDGSPIPVTSNTATYDSTNNSWTFAAPGTNELRWNLIDAGLSARSTFSGIIAQQSVDEEAALELRKSATLRPGRETPLAGDTIDYTFVLTNTGTAPIKRAVISDPMPGLSKLLTTWPSSAGELNPGESAASKATYTLTQADVDAGVVTNIATAVGTTSLGTAIETGPAQASLALTQTSEIGLTLTAETEGISAPAQPGEVVQYIFTVTNTGNTTLQETSVAASLDGQTEVLWTWPAAVGNLAPGAAAIGKASYALKQPDLDAGHLPNSAIASGDGPGGTPVESARAQVDVVLPGEAALALSKTVDDAQIADPTIEGDTVDYVIVVTNTGNKTLVSTTIADDLPGLPDLEITWPAEPGVLIPGQTVTATSTYPVTRQDIAAQMLQSTATATALSPEGLSLQQQAFSSVQLYLSAPVEPAPDPIPTPATDPRTPASDPRTPALARTGVEITSPFALGAAIVILGLVLITGTRARRHAERG